MSDEQAFRDALAANPADDTTRLVYADWLDEHGEPAKAEYLRLVVGLIPHFETGKPDPPEVGRVVALSEKLPADWRLAAAARFTPVLYGTDAAHKIHAIKLVRELTGQGLAEAKRFVESLPARFPNRTTLEGAIGIRGHLSQPGIVVAVHPADVAELPRLATYEFVADLDAWQVWEDPNYQIPAEAFDAYRGFLAAVLGPGVDVAALDLSDQRVVVATGVEVAEAARRLAELRAKLPVPGPDDGWVISVSSYLQSPIASSPN